MSSPTNLRDQLLFLEARLAMAEDRLSILRSQLRNFARAALSTLELAALYFAVVLLGKHYGPKEKP